MTGPELASLIASVVSVTLALVAIVIALLFYFKGAELSRRTDQSANRIESGVEQLSGVLQSLHTETFGLVRDQMSGMQRQLFSNDVGSDSSNEEIESQTRMQIEDLKRQFDDQFGGIVQRLEISDSTVQAMRQQVIELAGSVIDQSTEVASQVQLETIRKELMETLGHGAPIPGEIIVTLISDRWKTNRDVAVGLIISMIGRGELVASTPEGQHLFAEKGHIPPWVMRPKFLEP